MGSDRVGHSDSSVQCTSYGREGIQHPHEGMEPGQAETQTKRGPGGPGCEPREQYQSR